MIFLYRICYIIILFYDMLCMDMFDMIMMGYVITITIMLSIHIEKIP